MSAELFLFIQLDPFGVVFQLEQLGVVVFYRVNLAIPSPIAWILGLFG